MKKISLILALLVFNMLSVSPVFACTYQQSDCTEQKEPFWSSMYNSVYSYFDGYFHEADYRRYSYSETRQFRYHSDSLEDKNRDEPNDDYDYIYSDYSHSPIRANDGHYLTLGEFDDAYGTIAIQCTNDGMWVTGDAYGLVPYGQYSIWPHDYDYRSVVGSYGNLDYTYPGQYYSQTDVSQTFRASQWGDADISFFVPNGHSFLQGGNCNDLEDKDLRFSGMYQPYNGYYNGQADYIEQFEFSL